MLPVLVWPEVVEEMLEVPKLMEVVVPMLKQVELEVVDVVEVEVVVVEPWALWLSRRDPWCQ